ncbi:hypothetical protein VTL71DRAFT_7155 [Oculimacula yallundae]|uniref:Uncharacterized protein n=1 Tax=Oculimacula yallundae TaxID=86028 RepID=A0ABR4BVW7_9HELO
MKTASNIAHRKSINHAFARVNDERNTTKQNPLTNTSPPPRLPEIQQYQQHRHQYHQHRIRSIPPFHVRWLAGYEPSDD